MYDAPMYMIYPYCDLMIDSFPQMTEVVIDFCNIQLHCSLFYGQKNYIPFFSQTNK